MSQTDTARTPGPWRATDSPNDACCWNYHVEAAEAKDGFDQPVAVADVLGKENAEFIARAPQVEEALIEAVKALKALDDICHDYLTHKAQCELHVSDARKAAAAAIEKAKAAGVPL